MIDRKGDLFGRQADIHRLQHCAHHRDRKERLEKPMTVPIEDAYGVAWRDACLAQGRSETADPFPDLAVCEALQVTVDHLLIQRLHARRMP